MKALDEIYNIYKLLHRSDFNISAKKSSVFFKLNTSVDFTKIRVFHIFPIAFAIFTLNFDEKHRRENKLSEFRDTSQKMQKYIEVILNYAEILPYLAHHFQKFPE